MVKGALEALPNVMVTGVSYFKGRANVLYDPEQVTVAEMATALSRYGYRCSPIDGA